MAIICCWIVPDFYKFTIHVCEIKNKANFSRFARFLFWRTANKWTFLGAISTATYLSTYAPSPAFNSILEIYFWDCNCIKLRLNGSKKLHLLPSFQCRCSTLPTPSARSIETIIKIFVLNRFKKFPIHKCIYRYRDEIVLGFSGKVIIKCGIFHLTFGWNFAIMCGKGGVEGGCDCRVSLVIVDVAKLSVKL